MPRRFTVLALSVAASLAIADPAGAVLKHYDVHWTIISQFNTANPNVNKFPPRTDESRCGLTTDCGDASFGVIDQSTSGPPVLKRLLLITEVQVSAEVPGLSNFIFLSSRREAGPKKKLSFTGAGSTATTIAWGLVTGWTVTGGFWCNTSASAFVCTYVGGKNLATTEPQLYSSHYDLGTWTFHGTGFTSVPFVHQVAAPTSMSVGNQQYQLRGRLAAGLVPAVPVLGVALLGASLLFAGGRLARRRGSREEAGP